MAPVIVVRDLSTHITLTSSVVQAVGNIDLHIEAGETLGLVGESGCGKSMTVLSIMGLLPPGGSVAGGSIKLGSRELAGLRRDEMRRIRGNEIAMIFQDPLTSLDPTKTIIQPQILTLLRDLKDRLGMAMLLIIHDMGGIAGHADRVSVMYAGRVVETTDAGTLFSEMRHPYTQGLLGSVPGMHDAESELETIEGNVPSIYRLPPGCVFHNRCKYAMPVCCESEPEITVDGARAVKCWRCTGRGGRQGHE